MHAPVHPKVGTREVFAIAGPAMVANLTTPLIGIVSTTAIGRLDDAALLGGVAMASVIFDCLFWLFGFLRMSTLASPRNRWARVTRASRPRSWRAASSLPA
ncbi:Na+-driven multidrug efflux pump [Bradyrhizobium ottawaense]